MRGLSASGKTTWARAHAPADRIITSDQIRLKQFGKLLADDGTVLATAASEQNVLDEVAQKLETLMQDSRLVLLDATNTRPHHIHRWLSIAQRNGYTTYAVDLTDVPFEVCQQRNATRSFQQRVPERILQAQADRIKKHPLPPEIIVLSPDKAAKLVAELTG